METAHSFPNAPPAVHTFILSINVNAATVYGGCVLIFVREKERQIVSTRHTNIYTEFVIVWPA